MHVHACAWTVEGGNGPRGWQNEGVTGCYRDWTATRRATAAMIPFPSPDSQLLLPFFPSLRTNNDDDDDQSSWRTTPRALRTTTATRRAARRGARWRRASTAPRRGERVQSTTCKKRATPRVPRFRGRQLTQRAHECSRLAAICPIKARAAKSPSRRRTHTKHQRSLPRRARAADQVVPWRHLLPLLPLLNTNPPPHPRTSYLALRSTQWTESHAQMGSQGAPS